MKKSSILLVTAFVFLIGISVFVLAESLVVPIEKGWNLVYGLDGVETPRDILSGSEIQAQNIKAIYIYIPQINSYARVHPKPEVEKILQYLTENDVENSVFWVYSDKQGTGRFNVDGPIPFEERILNKGWNFYPIYEEMVGKQINEFRGNCEVERIYAFEPTRQQWINLIDEEMQRETLGLGIVVKVKNECRFGEVGDIVTPPPAIPNSGLRQDIENYYYEEVSYEVCELNPYANAGYASEAECKETVRCAGQIFAALVKEADLESLAQEMEERGGESPAAEYLRENLDIHEIYEIRVRNCPGYQI